MDSIYLDFWQVFLEETGAPDTTVLQNYTYFGSNEEESVAVLEQFLAGEKTVISHCIPAYLAKQQRMPRIGDYTMVMDFYGNPCCILHTVDVTIAPLPEISGDLITKDCPGLSRKAWLSRKKDEYTALAAKGGFHYHDEIPVLMEQVALVYPVKH